MQNQKYTKDGVNKETYKLLFNQTKENKRECSKEIFTIERSSLYNRNYKYNIFYIFLRIIMDMYFNEVNYLSLHKNIFAKGYTFKNNNLEFKFDYLEKYIKKILKNEDSYVKREMIFHLKNNLRYGDCFCTNMIISANIKNSFFVTGLIPYEDGNTHLHSFVEYKDYVIDYTKNLIMPKEKYFQLLKIKELQRVDYKNIANMYNTLLENRILNTTRFMATFGNEIISDLNRNAGSIKKNKNDRPDFSCMF